MKNLLLLCSMILFIGISTSNAQTPRSTYLYLEVNKNLPVSIKLNDRSIRNERKGYIIIPRMKDGKNTLEFEFANPNFKNHKFEITSNGKRSMGLKLMRISNNKFVLQDVVNKRIISDVNTLNSPPIVASKKISKPIPPKTEKSNEKAELPKRGIIKVYSAGSVETPNPPKKKEAKKLAETTKRNKLSGTSGTKPKVYAMYKYRQPMNNVKRSKRYKDYGKAKRAKKKTSKSNSNISTNKDAERKELENQKEKARKVADKKASDLKKKKIKEEKRLQKEAERKARIEKEKTRTALEKKATELKEKRKKEETERSAIEAKKEKTRKAADKKASDLKKKKIKEEKRLQKEAERKARLDKENTRAALEKKAAELKEKRKKEETERSAIEAKKEKASILGDKKITELNRNKIREEKRLQKEAKRKALLEKENVEYLRVKKEKEIKRRARLEKREKERLAKQSREQKEADIRETKKRISSRKKKKKNIEKVTPKISEKIINAEPISGQPKYVNKENIENEEVDMLPVRCTQIARSEKVANWTLKLHKKFDDEARMNYVRRKMGHQCITTNNLGLILGNMETQIGRYKMIKSIYNRIDDRANLDRLYKYFKSKSYIDKLKQLRQSNY